jgi:hypothetical protein
VGPFNEQLLTNEDYEYNVRIRRLGGTVWFNPGIRSVYLARPNLAALARQYARYGFWKARMLRRHPGSLRWRQALPPLFALSTVGLAALSTFAPIARTALAVEWGAYVLLLLLYGLREAARRRQPGLVAGFPLAVATIHLTWGGAFWPGLIRGLLGAKVGTAPK